MADERVKTVDVELMLLPAAKAVGVRVMLPDLVMTGVAPAAEMGQVTVTVVPDEVAEQLAAPIAASTRLATVLVLLLLLVPPVMMFVPFTVMLETDVLPVPETVMVAVATPAPMVTTGWKPVADAGPVMVTTLLAAAALKPPTVILPATLVAIVVELEVAAVAPLMICVPFTLMPDVIEEVLPLKVTVAVGSGGVVAITGMTPATDAGPLIVTVLPEAVAL
jgi:hypothetical protein